MSVVVNECERYSGAGLGVLGLGAVAQQRLHRDGVPAVRVAVVVAVVKRYRHMSNNKYR